MNNAYENVKPRRMFYLVAFIALVTLITMGSLCHPPIIGWEQVEREYPSGDIKFVLEPIYDMSGMPWYAHLGIRQDGGFLLGMLGFFFLLLAIRPSEWGAEEKPSTKNWLQSFKENLKRNWKQYLEFGVPPALILTYLAASNTFGWGDEPIWLIIFIGYPVLVFAWIWVIALLYMVVYIPIILKEWLVSFLRNK